MADSANRARLTGHSFLDSAKTGEGRRQRGQNLWRICSLLGLGPRQEEAGKRSEGARIPSTDSPRPPDESAAVQRTTQISPALAGLLPSAPPPFPQGLVAASVAADSSRTPGRSSWTVVVKPTLRGMRPISRFPGPHLSSLKGRRPRRSRFPRPRGSPGGTHGESANVDVVLAGPHAGGGGVWCARRGGGGGGAPPPPPLRGRVSRCRRRRRRRLAPLRCRAGVGGGEPLATSG